MSAIIGTIIDNSAILCKVFAGMGNFFPSSAKTNPLPKILNNILSNPLKPLNNGKAAFNYTGSRYRRTGSIQKMDREACNSFLISVCNA